MLRRALAARTAFAALAALVVISQPVAAGSCTILSENAIGLNQGDAADRAKKQLKRKISRWADKNGYKSVQTIKSAILCTKKGGLAQCTASAKVCG